MTGSLKGSAAATGFVTTGTALPGVNKFTKGRNNYNSLYNTSMTKLRKETIKNGIIGNSVSGLYLDTWYGLKQTYNELLNE